MTKLRAPLSIDAALARIAGHMPRAWEQMADIAGRKVRTVRNWGDPDTPEQIPLDCAIALDLAFIEAGGAGAPLFEAYATKLELDELARHADRIELGRQTASVIRECGEAGGALVLASQPGATPAHRRDAMRECAEALDTLKRVLPLLDQGEIAPESMGAPTSHP